MKIKITILTAILFLSLRIFAQAPQQINYQAVARDLSGNPMVTSPITLTFDVLQGSSAGLLVYSEDHTGISTNAFGLFTAPIGGGMPNSPFVISDFANINWGLNTYHLRVTVNGDVMPATQLLSVPYALHANTATSGTPGTDGLNCWDLNGNGAQDVSEDVNNDGLWNALDCKGDSGVAGLAGVNGINGLGITWLGTFASAPGSPNLNAAYYNSVLGQSFIWDGTAWQLITQDGTSTILSAGNGIDITGNVITSTLDTSDINELQTLSINTTNDTIFLTNGSFVPLPSASGDGWGADTIVHTGTNISGQGTIGSPLTFIETKELPLTANIGEVIKWNGSAWVTASDSVNDADADATNEIQNLSWNSSDSNIIDLSSGTGIQLASNTPAPNQVLTWNGANWIAQNPGSGADNWGAQVVQVDGTTITGDGDLLPLSGFDGQYSSLTGAPTNVSSFTNDVPYLTSFTEVDGSITNELQNLSTAGNSINISSGTGTTISSVAPTTGDYLYWNGLNWVSQPIVAGSDNQDLQLAGNSLSLTNDATPVDLSPFMDNTDAQTLTYNSGAQALSISGGNVITLVVDDADANATNEIQTLSFATPNLTISGTGGNTVDLSTLLTNDGDWTINANDMYSAVSGNIGIGTPTPSAKLDIESTSFNLLNLTTTAANSNANINITNTGGGAAQFRQTGGTGGYTFYTQGSGINPAFVVTDNGYVGINNIPSPLSELDVNGQITMRTGGTNGWIPVSDNNGTMMWTDPSTLSLGSAWLVNGINIYSGNTGNVGIGTSIPSFPLHVNTSTMDRAGYFINSTASNAVSGKYGVYAATSGNGTGNNIGGWFDASGTATGINYGVGGQALGTATENRAVYGNAVGGTANWAGYFESGDVYIQNDLGVGTLNPIMPLHVEGNTYINGVTSIGGTTALAATLKVFSGFGTGTAYFFDGGGQPSLSVLSSGNVTIGNTTSVGRFFVQDNNTNTTGAVGSFISVQNLANATNTTAGIRFRTGGSSALNGDFHYKGAIYFEDGTGTNGEGDMIFAVNNVASNANVTTADARMTISSSGDVGVGTTVPTAKLSVNETTGNAAFRVQLNGGTQFTIANNGNTALYFNNTPAYKLTLNTNSAAKPTSNVWTIASDGRLKKDVKPYKGGLEDILKINPIWFTYNGKAGMPEETGVGIIAQELQKIAPYMVSTWTYVEGSLDEENPRTDGAKTDYLAVDNGAMTYMLINAVKEQQQQIEDLKKEIQELKNK